MKSIIFSILLLVFVVAAGPVKAFTYTQTLPSNTIYFDDFSNYTTPTTCTTASIACLPGWGAYDNATGGAANITTWHPLASSGKSMYMQSPTVASGKFDRHRSWAQTAGQTRISASQWFQFDQIAKASNFANRNEIHFSIEMAGPDGNFHECVQELFLFTPYADEYISINDGVFAYNVSLNAYDRGTFAGNPEAIWDNNQWHYEKITMDISNPTSPSCIFMQVDNLILSNLQGNAGWATTYGNKVNWQGTGSVATSHGLGGTYTAQTNSLPWRLEIAMINGGSTTISYHSWHTNILITDDSPNPSIVQFSLFNAALMLALFLPAALIGLSLKMFKIRPGQKIGTMGTETPKSYLKKALVLITIVALFALVALIVR